MKRFLSMVLALMLVFALTSGIVAMAEEMELSEEEIQALMEQYGGEEEVIEQPAEPKLPDGYDESTIKQYLIYNFTDLEKISIKVYMTANEVTLGYLMDSYTAYGQPVSEAEYEGQKVIVLAESEFALEDALNGTDFVYVDKEGLFSNTKIIVFPFGTMIQEGFSEGDEIATFVIENGKKSESYKIIAGENNTVVYEIKEYNWVNIVIAVMILVLLILILIIILVVIKIVKKKASKKDEDDYIEEIEELEEDAVEEDETEEIAEEIFEDAAEETEEVIEDDSEETNE